MAEGHLRVVNRTGATYRVTIPKDLAKELDIKKNDDIWWELHRDHLELYPVTVRPKTGSKIIRGED